MAANLSDHIPISVIETVSGNSPLILPYNEKASQTFLFGTPVQLTSGVCLVWDGVTYTRGILGIACLDGSNYATDGAGAPSGYNGVGPPGTTDTFGSVPFQPSAVNIAHGAPMADGRQLVQIACPDTMFIIQVDNGNASGGGTYTLAQANIGAQYGLTIDASGHWYLDLNKSTTGTNTAMEIVGPTMDGLIANARVIAKFVQVVFQIQ